MYKKFFILIACFITAVSSFPYKGTVKDLTGNPIYGAKVMLLSSGEYTRTDTLGNFGSVVGIKDNISGLYLQKLTISDKSITFDSQNKSNFVVDIYSFSGKLVYKNAGTLKSGLNTVKFEKLNIASGLYVVSLSINDRKFNTTHRFGFGINSIFGSKHTNINHTGLTASRKSVRASDTVLVTAVGYIDKIIIPIDTTSLQVILANDTTQMEFVSISKLANTVIPNYTRTTTTMHDLMRSDPFDSLLTYEQFKNGIGSEPGVLTRVLGPENHSFKILDFAMLILNKYVKKDNTSVDTSVAIVTPKDTSIIMSMYNDTISVAYNVSIPDTLNLLELDSSMVGILDSTAIVHSISLYYLMTDTGINIAGNFDLYLYKPIEIVFDVKLSFPNFVDTVFTMNATNIDYDTSSTGEPHPNYQLSTLNKLDYGKFQYVWSLDLPNEESSLGSKFWSVISAGDKNDEFVVVRDVIFFDPTTFTEKFVSSQYFTIDSAWDSTGLAGSTTIESDSNYVLPTGKPYSDYIKRDDMFSPFTPYKE